MRISDWSSDVCSSDLSCCWRWKARNSSNPQSPIPNAMTEAKRLAAEKAIEFVEDGMIVGVGTGSTVAWFIDALARIRHRIEGAVSSSEQSTARLRGHGIEVIELNNAGRLALYVDGADECDPPKCLITGGGATHQRGTDRTDVGVGEGGEGR